MPSQAPITKESVYENWEKNPKRICFSTCHKSALKKENGNYAGKFSIPFDDTVYPIFYDNTGMKLFNKFGNWWRSIGDEQEFSTIQTWIDKVGATVFLRDTLALSLALSENMAENGNRTEIGQLEYQAKYSQDINSINELTRLLQVAVVSTPFYREADLLCAIPPSDPNKFCLPNILIGNLASTLNKSVITSNLAWQKPKPTLKGIEIDQKWDALESVGLDVNVDLTGKTVLLLDDLYQSGITIQYVAMKLQQAGAEAIYGLSIVKSRRDTDNS